MSMQYAIIDYAQITEYMIAVSNFDLEIMIQIKHVWDQKLNQLTHSL